MTDFLYQMTFPNLIYFEIKYLQSCRSSLYEDTQELGEDFTWFFDAKQIDSKSIVSLFEYKNVLKKRFSALGVQ